MRQPFLLVGKTFEFTFYNLYEKPDFFVNCFHRPKEIVYIISIHIFICIENLSEKQKEAITYYTMILDINTQKQNPEMVNATAENAPYTPFPESM